MSKTILSFVIDADIARSSGTAEHPFSSGSRKLLESLSKNGHKIAMCPNLRKEWKKHQSLFATKWLASMVAKKKVSFIAPSEKTKAFLEKHIEDCKDKVIAMKDSHLIDAALAADKIIASNDNRAKSAFCRLSVKNREIGTVSWFNAVFDADFISNTLMPGGSIPSHYYLRAENL